MAAFFSAAALGMPYTTQELSDCQDIHDLCADYNYRVDTGDPDGYAGLFVENGEYDVVGHAVYRGREQLRPRGARCRHTVR